MGLCRTTRAFLSHRQNVFSVLYAWWTLLTFSPRARRRVKNFSSATESSSAVVGTWSASLSSHHLYTLTVAAVTPVTCFFWMNASMSGVIVAGGNCCLRPMSGRTSTSGPSHAGASLTVSLWPGIGSRKSSSEGTNAGLLGSTFALFPSRPLHSPQTLDVPGWSGRAGLGPVTFCSQRKRRRSSQHLQKILDFARSPGGFRAQCLFP